MVIGIHDQRRIEFARRPGKARQHQHAGILRILSRHVLLGHQVHAIAQRRHQTHVGGAEQPHHRAPVIALVQVADRRPVQLGEMAVDMAGMALQLTADVLVGDHVRPRRRRDLHELHRPVMLGEMLQQLLERLEALYQPLRVVEAVDADDGLVGHALDAARDELAPRAIGLGLLLDDVRHHADGIDAHAEIVAVGGQAAVFLQHAAHLAGDVVLEGQLVGVGLEADQVIEAQGLEQFVVRRDRGEDLRRREGNVQEEADAVANAQHAAGFGEGNQVIVVHPDDVIGLEQRLQALGHGHVDPPIAVVLFPVVTRQIDPIVEDRPEGGVGETAVVVVVVALGQAKGHIVDVVLGLGLGRPVFLDRLAVPAEPDAARLAQGVQYAHCQTTRGRLAFFDRGHPIRYHH